MVATAVERQNYRSLKGGFVEQEPAAKRLGRRLKELRNERELSQSDVDRHFGWKDNTTYRLETGNAQKFPSPETLRELANFYGVSVMHLLEAAGYIEAPVA